MQLGTSLEFKQFDLTKKDKSKSPTFQKINSLEAATNKSPGGVQNKNFVLKDFANFTENTYDAESFQNNVSGQHRTTF